VGEAEQLARFDVARLRAENPGPLTLSGTNPWVFGRDPCWVIDPGPLLESHLDAVAAEVERRGGAGGVAVTHDHGDHIEGVEALRRRLGGVPVAGARGAEVTLSDGDHFGPLEVLSVPGHAPDHLAFLAGRVCFTGDAVLGEGSVFVAPDPGALAGYLAALRRMVALPLELICPGHGPAVLDPHAKLEGYIAHRLDRERSLLAALETGLRSTDDLLDAAWSDVPPPLRPVAAVTLAAHLDKLEEEGRLPEGVQRL
jgi:glyoxylase-like metal-dependent hydrolase (beta-lactamase superfamily II)